MNGSVLIINWGFRFLRGGGESSALALYNLFSEAASTTQVRIVCASSCIGKARLPQSDPEVQTTELPTLVFYWSSTSSVSQALTWARRLLKWGSLYFFEVLAALYAATFRRASLIICSDMYVAAFISSHMSPHARVLLRLHGAPSKWHQRWLIRHGRFDIVSNGEDSLAASINAERIHRLSVPLPEYFAISEIDLKKKWQSKSFQICYAGRFEHTKGTDRIFDYVSKLASRVVISQVEIYGDGGQMNLVSAQVAALKKQGIRTTLSPSVPRREICDLLKQSHILLLPSRTDFSPNVVREALAVGCLVLLSPELKLQFDGVPNVFGLDEFLEAQDTPHFSTANRLDNAALRLHWLEFAGARSSNAL